MVLDCEGVAVSQRALMPEPLTAERIVKRVDAWPEEKRCRFWERVGIASSGRFDAETIVRVWERHIEGGG